MLCASVRLTPRYVLATSVLLLVPLVVGEANKKRARPHALRTLWFGRVFRPFSWTAVVGQVEGSCEPVAIEASDATQARAMHDNKSARSQALSLHDPCAAAKGRMCAHSRLWAERTL